WVTRTPETDYVGGDYGFRSIDFSNKANGIAVGERGSIFKYYENHCSVTNYSNYTYVDNSNGNVSFTNTSTGSFNQLNWAFGDGNTSSLTSPNHNFSANGTYVVVLTINDSVTSCLDYYTDTITVTGVISPTQCTAGFVIYPDTTTGDIIVINSSTGSNLTYLWDFGDGNTSSQAYPSYTYTSTGNFYLCLTIDDGAGCIDMYCDSIGENGVVFNKQIGFTINVIATPVITGIEENNLESSLEIEIYPNPTLSQLTIDTELDISEIIIVDITGKTIKTIKQNTNSVNVANLSNGIYFIKVITDEKTITKKFVKQ
ncbi:MAG: T9SS type A sorting domain-containing protein, partial [Bacteroidetes bacterium]|nr:T9SS type A sorting domain-containing protein [Bacteroidota bacterium]